MKTFALAGFFKSSELINHVEEKLPTLNDFEWEVYLEEAEKAAIRHGLAASCGNFFSIMKAKEKGRRQEKMNKFWNSLNNLF